MKRFMCALIGGAVAIGSAQATLAADLPVKAPPIAPPVAYDPWTGFYVGASLGGRWSQTDWTTVDFDRAAPAPSGVDNPAGLDRATFRVGGYAGYNWKIAPAWLVGIEGDIAWGNSSKTHTPFPGSSVFSGIVPGNDFVTVKLDWDASIRGRVGYLLTPTWLLYATGGAAWQEIKTSASCSGVGGNSSYCVGAFSDSTSTTKSGWTVGGGVEAAFAPHWLARIEYRYADFGDVSNTFPKAPNFGFHANISVKTNTALVGVAYKF